MKIGKHLLYILYNRFKFSFKGIKYGKNMKIYDQLRVKMDEGAKIVIGDNFTFISGGGYNPIMSNVQGSLRLNKNAKLIIGNNCGLSSAVLWIRERITLGNNVLVGGGALILDNDCHSLNYQYRNGSIRGAKGENIDAENILTSPVIIEDDVMIGARCIILKGVTIGARSIIGAGSVVVKSIPSDCIAAGNPCRVIKKIDNN